MALVLGNESAIAMLKDRYKNIRSITASICEPLAHEDHVVQPAVFVSPPKWHLAHSTWFFEQFILAPHKNDYKIYNSNYNYLFNSYYESIGSRLLRTDRGNMTRPGVEEILKYREYVDNEMQEFLDKEIPANVNDLVELGLNHEQQHQELLFTDIKYILGHNPLFPSYKSYTALPSQPRKESYREVEEGIYEIGHNGSGFCFDNEKGTHRVFLHSFRFMDRLVTNGEYMEFISDRGYTNALLWLGEGWEWVKQNSISAPLYWYKMDNEWYNYTLSGLSKVEKDSPVTHVSFFEAEAYARWKGKRLLTEFEWEAACRKYHDNVPPDANFSNKGLLHPSTPLGDSMQLLGDAWEWTNSAYLPYPFYKQEKGALGEYNGKFMINQMVLRGGSCATPHDHMRISYRNFFHPEERWQFTGIRLAENTE